MKFSDLFTNIPLVAATISCISAQLIKPFIEKLSGHGFDRHMMVSNGGMPSSHTATVVALTTAIAMTEGLGSIAFAICFVFSFIVMHDAMNIRWEAGKQAEVINEWSKILSQIHKDGAFTPTNLKTLLGHSFAQVFGGIIHGLAVGILVTNLMM